VNSKLGSRGLRMLSRKRWAHLVARPLWDSGASDWIMTKLLGFGGQEGDMSMPIHQVWYGKNIRLERGIRSTSEAVTKRFSFGLKCRDDSTTNSGS